MLLLSFLLLREANINALMPVAMIFLSEAFLAGITLVRFDLQMLSYMVLHIGCYRRAIVALLTEKFLIFTVCDRVEKELPFVQGF